MAESNQQRAEDRSATLPDLSDFRVIYQLCFEYLEAEMEMSAKVSEDKITSEEAAQKSTELVQWMTWTLLGENPQFKAKTGWSGKPLADYLKGVFASELSALSDADHENFMSENNVVMFAMCTFMTDVHDLMMKIQEHTEDTTEVDARLCHDLCVKWTEIFTNEKFPVVV